MIPNIHLRHIHVCTNTHLQIYMNTHTGTHAGLYANGKRIKLYINKISYIMAKVYKIGVKLESIGRT